MDYKWHHIVVSVLCICALAVIVSSLVSTFNNINNMKKKRDINKRDIDSDESDDVAFNVMELNNADMLTKDTNFDLGDDIMSGGNTPVKFIPPVSNALAKNITQEQARKKQLLVGKIGSDTDKHRSKNKLQNNTMEKKTHMNFENALFPSNSGTKKLETVRNSSNPHAKREHQKKPIVYSEERDIKHDHGVEIPAFPTNYHASGLLVLPRSGIAEPFEIWFAPTIDKSRIDYYYGTDKTFQRGDKGEYGVSYKYVPMYNDINKTFDGCWLVKGCKSRKIIPQIITPNITWFKYNKTEVYTGTLTTKWTYHYTAFGMKNFQSVWITKSKPFRPIRYEMYGFDMMLGSYYDSYVIEYISFDTWDGDEGVFELPKNIECFEWGNSLAAAFFVNPMKEFAAFSPDSAVNHTRRYEEFKEKNHKENKRSTNEHLRKYVFKDNARFIDSHNRRNLVFKLKPNHFTDKMDEELIALHSTLEKDTRNHIGEKSVEKIAQTTSSLKDSNNLPEQLDWRDFGAVSAVKGQGICGSCYAFSASEATEGAWYRKTSKRVDLSTQQLIDCSWGSGNHGCKGGHYAGALSWIYLNGISTAKSYGKYLGQEGYCHFNDTWFGANIDGFFYVQPWNKTALKHALAMHGPVAISINTQPLSFKFYSHGIYNDPVCVKNATTHSALVVGYGKKNGKEFWIVKNSWSDLWGEHGFMRISMDNDLCGVTEYPVAVIVNRPSFVFPQTEKIKPEDIDIDTSLEENISIVPTLPSVSLAPKPTITPIRKTSAPRVKKTTKRPKSSNRPKRKSTTKKPNRKVTTEEPEMTTYTRTATTTTATATVTTQEPEPETPKTTKKPKSKLRKPVVNTPNGKTKLQKHKSPTQITQPTHNANPSNPFNQQQSSNTFGIQQPPFPKPKVSLQPKQNDLELTSPQVAPTNPNQITVPNDDDSVDTVDDDIDTNQTPGLPFPLFTTSKVKDKTKELHSKTTESQTTVTTKSKMNQTTTIPFSGLHISTMKDDLKKFKLIFSDDTPEIFDGIYDSPKGNDKKDNSQKQKIESKDTGEVESGVSSDIKVTERMSKNKDNIQIKSKDLTDNKKKLQSSNIGQDIQKGSNILSSNPNKNSLQSHEIAYINQTKYHSQHSDDSVAAAKNQNTKKEKQDPHNLTTADEKSITLKSKTPKRKPFGQMSKNEVKKLLSVENLPNGEISKKKQRAKTRKTSKNKKKNKNKNAKSNRKINTNRMQNKAIKKKGRKQFSTSSKNNKFDFTKLGSEDTASPEQKGKHSKMDIRKLGIKANLTSSKQKQIDFKKLGTKEVTLSEQDEVHELLKSLNDVVLSNENTEHSQKKLIKTHKHSRRLRLNPENVGSLNNANDEGDKKKPKPLPMKVTLKEAKKTTITNPPNRSTTSTRRKGLSTATNKKKGDTSTINKSNEPAKNQ